MHHRFLKASLRLLIMTTVMVLMGPINPAEAVDEVRVYKSQRVLQLLEDGRVVDEYKIALGFNPTGHKLFEGDGRTPVGRYRLTWRNPESQFYRSINISYPDPADKAVARSLGQQAGGLIMIHGLPNGMTAKDVNHPREDWTNGCIAVNNEQMDYIWDHVGDGTPIQIRP